MKDKMLSKLYFGGVSLCLFAFMAVAAGAQTQQLPISIFLDQLGPTTASAWSDPASGNLVVFDTYGKRNALLGLNLGTTVDGSVSVILRNDDTQRIVVNIKTRNALCYGFDWTSQPAFGYRGAELINGIGTAATGSGNSRIVFAPQPVGPLNFDWPRETETANLRCDGSLRAASGYPDGTPGFAQTTQVGLYSTGAPGGCPLEHDADCFPAEKVQFKPTGN